ncbi:hypothetical protein AF335_27075 [Streptomyces eurocidicus]|uniref:Uncharacterized protein n=1 Tax=Streptomyces eurocidicus TaxID=66423 RepID=A0A2N8NQE6_STREU|nr:hypothetical protein [Streptomyces eurocidicus]MBB5123096.1 hypothetical protein [Streptomyces eurocidicus]MBF6056226.1 hypothetical protein [Streptomyces eurocidicus]PNE30988.1 hypothetical protein AF335_27075 [Streptomyces eurocidicus]
MRLDELRHRYRTLIDPSAGPGPHTPASFRIDPADPPLRGDLRASLTELFAREPGIDAVALVADGTTIGLVPRDATGDPEEPGLRSDGGTGGPLPGYATGYELLYFTCPQCTGLQVLTHLDDGEPPLCARVPEHGRVTRVDR